jgi:hypothetical protein
MIAPLVPLILIGTFAGWMIGRNKTMSELKFSYILKPNYRVEVRANNAIPSNTIVNIKYVADGVYTELSDVKFVNKKYVINGLADRVYTIHVDVKGSSGPFRTSSHTIINPQLVVNNEDLTTLAIVPFLIRGPRYQTSASDVLDWYINCDAVGDSATPPHSQLFGSYFCATQTANPSSHPFQSGMVLGDNTGLDNSSTNSYITSLQSKGVKVCTSIGGYLADVLGMMGPYSPPGIVDENPDADDLANSIANVVLGVTSASNPLSWSKTNWSTISFDGINLDFENIARGGNPAFPNQFPQPIEPAPSFPASIEDTLPGSQVTYGDYITSLQLFLQTLRTAAPNKIITLAPLSPSTNTDGLTPNTACTNALNSWAPFDHANTPPSLDTFNAPEQLPSGSKALLAPQQLALCDDLFVQFYNERPELYIGGVDFINLVAQWGFLCLFTQKNIVGSRNVRVNIGLANGTTFSNGQGVTAPLEPSNTYFYPQFQQVSPPNPNATMPQVQGFQYPNIGVTVDAPNLNSALIAANTILQSSGLEGAANIQISDWCSGIGFWAGGSATQKSKSCYSFSTNQMPHLPTGYTYCWSDAQYPASDPLWASMLPINVTT